MGTNTKIEWCDHTFNAWIGCTQVSPGCDHCYAERQNKHWKWNGGSWGPKAPRYVTSQANWDLLKVWDRQAEREGRMHRVFVNSLSDTFDPEVSEDMRIRLWIAIVACPHLEFLLLTKRPEHWPMRLPITWISGAWPANVRLGFTAEDQQRFDERWESAQILCRRTEMRHRFFVSAEPLLGPINLPSDGLDWVICGGESGPDARPMHPDWARGLRDQCTAAKVPFFFKQWGEWVPTTDPRVAEARGIPLEQCMSYLGKKLAGCLLDGREWKQFPEVKRG